MGIATQMGAIVIGRAVCALSLALLASGAQARTYALITAGLGGEAEYEKKFAQQAEALAGAMTHLDPDGSVTLLTGTRASAAAMQRELAAIAERATAGDRLIVMLIGHGSFDGEEYRFNLPGPDVTASELANWLDRIAAREQLTVLTSSASGGAAPRLQGGANRRIVVAATKSGVERNATRFAEFWTRALTTSEADVDKDEWVTVREAFDYAQRKVADDYKAQAALATEHARLSEGDSRALQAPLARLGAAKSMPTDPQLRELIAERLRLERAVDAVKARKSELGDERYYDELEKALVSLARMQMRIDARQAQLDGVVKDGGRVRS